VPLGGLFADDDGRLYGTTITGGDYGGGTVFVMIPAGGKFRVLHSFCSSGCVDGAEPYGNLAFDSAGSLYGTTFEGGTGRGVVYRLSRGPRGELTQTVLYAFSGGEDGGFPTGGVLVDSVGNVFGTTYYGGTGSCSNGFATGCGVVFELYESPEGTWNEKVLHSFSGPPDGQYPSAGLVQDASGHLYSTTVYGGANGSGTVFEMTPAQNGDWTTNILYSFCALSNCEDGDDTSAGVSLDRTGNLYGTAAGGGKAGGGVIFELSPSGNSWTESILHDFCVTNCPADGDQPRGGVFIDPARNLYGTTLYGGASGVCCGLVFQLSHGGYTSFPLPADGSGGIGPEASVTLAKGHLYGMTPNGGLRSSSGVLFRISP
jgi:uncharacterized repeat protein (TIGR03803 family)